MPSESRIADLSEEKYAEVLRRVRSGEKLVDVRSELLKANKTQDT